MDRKAFARQMKSLTKIFWGIKTYLFYNIFYLRHIGKLCYIGKPLFWNNTKKNLSIGNKVRIYPNSRIEIFQNGKIIIGNNVSIGNDCHIACGSLLTIGKDAVISSYVFITDISHSFDNVDGSFLKNKIVCKKTEIGDGTFIGRGCAILSGVSIGKHCVIGCNSVVKSDIPDYSMCVGSPARIVKCYDRNSCEWKKIK